jgi:hypothetical protein
MNSALGVALLVAGAFLLVMGFNASQAPVEDVTRFFTGNFTDRTVWMLVAGAGSMVAGLVLVTRRGHSRA